MVINQLLLFSLIVTLCFCHILESPRVTNWGTWTGWQRCPPDQFVVGMQLKVARNQENRFGDNTALNGIKLL